MDALDKIVEHLMPVMVDEEIAVVAVLVVRKDEAGDLILHVIRPRDNRGCATDVVDVVPRKVT